jgi:hypothetical protein
MDFDFLEREAEYDIGGPAYYPAVRRRFRSGTIIGSLI